MRVKVVDNTGATVRLRDRVSTLLDFDEAEPFRGIPALDGCRSWARQLNDYRQPSRQPYRVVIYETDYEVISQLLAARNRRTSLRITLEGSTLSDRGVSNGRFARPTDFRFTLDGQLQGHNRALKGRWLIRGWRKAARFK